MDALIRLLEQHRSAHPAAEIQDTVKFLHQSFMGPGHLIPDESAAIAKLEEEWDQIPGDPSAPPAELLGNGLCRLSLSYCKGIGLSTKTVAKIFFHTARDVVQDAEGLQKMLDSIVPHNSSEAEYLAQYRSLGCPMVSHSESYRAAYAPAYRVVFSDFLNLLPVLAAIDLRMAEGGPVFVALDGPCASGKSTLGARLAEIYGCPLFHMDDFFLRPEQRTPERLAQPGGNVDYERFDREILTPLAEGRPACFRPWQCHSGHFADEQTVPPGPLMVVEGSYSMRPELRERYDLRVWVEAPWEVRLERLSRRGGADCVQRYQTLWIPMEDRYFEFYQVKGCCHIVISGCAPTNL